MDYKTAAEIKMAKKKEYSKPSVVSRPSTVEVKAAEFVQFAERKNFENSSRKETWSKLAAVKAPSKPVVREATPEEKERYAKDYAKALAQREIDMKGKHNG